MKKATAIDAQLIKASARVNDIPVVYARLYTDLVQCIRSGRYEPGMRLPGENVLADHYQISRASVRLALERLEQEGAIRKESGKGSFVRESVPPAAVPFILGTNVREAGLDSSPGWYSGWVLKALMRQRGRHGMRLALVTDEEISSLTRDAVSALLLSTPHIATEMLPAIEQNGIPIVSFNYPLAGYAYATVDDPQETERCIRHLLGSGCSRILIPLTTGENLRERKIVELMRRYPGQLVTTPIARNRTDAFYMKAIMDGVQKEQPDALFLSNGSLAIGAFSALNKLERLPGRNIKVLCFDNVIHLAPIYQCRFDCVLMPFEEMARDAVDYLALKLKQPDTPLLQKVYPVKIVEANPETTFFNGE